MTRSVMTDVEDHQHALCNQLLPLATSCAKAGTTRLHVFDGCSCNISVGTKHV